MKEGWWCGHRVLVGGKWCRFDMETRKEIEVLSTDKFCSFCGTPRPKPEPLREQLAKKLYAAYPAHHAHSDVFKHMADVAIKFLEENK